MILLFSGPAGVGKTSITEVMEKCHGFKLLKSSLHLREIAIEKQIPISRKALQTIGDDLDIETNFQWIVDKVAIPQISRTMHHGRWLLDSIRKREQIAHFKKLEKFKVFHVHITASEGTIKTRFYERNLKGEENQYEKPYEELLQHPNEISSRQLDKFADFVLLYEKMTPAQAAEVILSKRPGE